MNQKKRLNLFVASHWCIRSVLFGGLRGRRAGIFTDEDMHKMAESKGMGSRMERSLFADASATVIGSVVGTSNVVTYVESATGIAAGGRTGLVCVVVAFCFVLSAFFAGVVSAVPLAATSPVLVIVGILMAASFADVAWREFEAAVTASRYAGMQMPRRRRMPEKSTENILR